MNRHTVSILSLVLLAMAALGGLVWAGPPVIASIAPDALSVSIDVDLPSASTETPPASQYMRDVNGNRIGDVVDIETTAAQQDCQVYLPLVVAQWRRPWPTPAAFHYPRLHANLFRRVPEDEAAYDALSPYGDVTAPAPHLRGGPGQRRLAGERDQPGTEDRHHPAAGREHSTMSLKRRTLQIFYVSIKPVLRCRAILSSEFRAGLASAGSSPYSKT